MQPIIRLYKPEDFDDITRLWFEAETAAMPKLMERMGHTLEDAREYFARAVVVENQIWVYERDGVPLGFFAIQGDFLDRLYVDPAWHRQGIGQALLVKVRQLLPKHIWLYTHAANKMARSFYEKNGFVAEKFGVSPEPNLNPMSNIIGTPIRPERSRRTFELLPDLTHLRFDYAQRETFLI